MRVIRRTLSNLGAAFEPVRTRLSTLNGTVAVTVQIVIFMLVAAPLAMWLSINLTGFALAVTLTVIALVIAWLLYPKQVLNLRGDIAAAIKAACVAVSERQQQREAALERADTELA